jgi:drug/metabolite transporter (DMT)-like permease
MTVSRANIPGDGGAPVAYLAFVIFAWGGNYTWVKLALEDGGAWTFNALRYGLALVILGLILAVAGAGRRMMPEPGERLPLALVGVLQIALMTGGTTLALQWIEASRTVLIAYSMPIWGMLLALAILGERPTRAMILGLVLGVAGLAVLFAPWTMDWTSRPVVAGSLVALGATLAWALGSVLYRCRRWQSGFWQQVFGQFVGGICVIIPAAFLFERATTSASPTYVAIILWNAVVPSILGFWCWARALDRVPVATASQVLLLSPVFGVLLSAVVLGERLGPALAVSAALIITGAILSYWRRPSAAPAAPPPRV